MTALQLVERLRGRGGELVPAGNRVRFRPVDLVTEAECAALRALKPDVLQLLADEGTKPTAGEAPVPTGPCGLCGGILAWVQDWPTAGECRWLCPTCASWPARSLAEVFATLTSEE